MGNVADYSQTWNNISNTAFTLVNSHVNLDPALDKGVTVPARKLLGGNGQETLAWTQIAMSFVVSGLNDGDVIWRAPNGRKFGVRIHVPVQVFGIGTAPYYKVKVDDGDWEGERDSQPYDFDESIGYKIHVKSVAGHGTLHLNITISDIDKED